MKKLVFFLLASLPLIQAEALLPPLYQTAAEIKTIIENKELEQKLQAGEAIQKIEKNTKGYEITTNRHQLQVNIEYEQLQKPGPIHFKLHFEDPVSLEN